MRRRLKGVRISRGNVIGGNPASRAETPHIRGTATTTSARRPGRSIIRGNVMSGVSHLLVVDDEPRLRKTLEMIIHGAGYQTTATSDGQSTLQALASANFDLAILDWQLPDMDGVALLKEIRRLYPKLPVVIMTGFGSSDTAETVLQLGARYFIFKPFDPRFIVSLVNDVLRKDKVLRPGNELFIDAQARYSIV